MTNNTIQEHIQEVETHVEEAGFSDIKFETGYTIISPEHRRTNSNPALHVKATITENKDLTNFTGIEQAFSISVNGDGDLELEWSFELPEDFEE